MVEGGSIFDADYPSKWVIFACRSTGGFPIDQIDTVLPDNTGLGGFPIIKYSPELVSAHPDTPVHR